MPHRPDPTPADRAAGDAPPRIRAVVVDDEPLAREELIHLLQSFDDVDLIGQAANGVELALLELKRLANVPADQPLLLTTELEIDSVGVDEAALARLVVQRPILHAAEEAVAMREGAVKIYRSQRLPSERFFGNMGFQAFPENMAPPGFD